MVQIFMRGKGFDGQKAERWFKERGVKYQKIDIDRYGLSSREFDSVKAQVGLRSMIDEQSAAYKASPIGKLSGESAIKDALMAAPKAYRSPIVRNGNKATVGYSPEVWETWE